VTGAGELIDYLMTVGNLSIAVAVWVLISIVCRVFPKIKAHRLWARVAPALPMLLCSVAVWIPGLADPELGVGSRIVLGILLGAISANAHKIFGQTVLGKDDRIQNGKR
jgi:hypothetical protein